MGRRLAGLKSVPQVQAWPGNSSMVEDELGTTNEQTRFSRLTTRPVRCLVPEHE
jgi:hypothetical protein